MVDGRFFGSGGLTDCSVWTGGVAGDDRFTGVEWWLAPFALNKRGLAGDESSLDDRFSGWRGLIGGDRSARAGRGPGDERFAGVEWWLARNERLVGVGGLAGSRRLAAGRRGLAGSERFLGGRRRALYCAASEPRAAPVVDAASRARCGFDAVKVREYTARTVGTPISRSKGSSSERSAAESSSSMPLRSAERSARPARNSSLTPRTSDKSFRGEFRSVALTPETFRRSSAGEAANNLLTLRTSRRSFLGDFAFF